MGKILNELRSAGRPLSKQDFIKRGINPDKKILKTLVKSGLIVKEEKYAYNSGHYRNEEGKFVPQKGTRYFVYSLA